MFARRSGSRRRRDLDAIRAAEIAPSEVAGLDDAELGQLAAWVRVPRHGLLAALTVLYSLPAPLYLAGAITRGHLAVGIGALLVVVTLMASTVVVFVVFSSWRHWWTRANDEFTAFGSSGAKAVRSLGDDRSPVLQRKTWTLRALRVWHAEGLRLGVEVDPVHERVLELLAAPVLTSTQVAQVRDLILKSLVDTARGQIGPARYESSRSPRQMTPWHAVRNVLRRVGEVLALVVAPAALIAESVQALRG